MWETEHGLQEGKNSHARSKVQHGITRE